jgi:hypothetical protein
VRDAVFGNVGTMVTFRVGAFDAEVLEKEFAPTFTAEDLVNLGKYQIYLKLMIDEVSSHPFSATTMNIIPQPEISFRRQVLENSWKQFTRPRAEVEEEIRKWHDVPMPTSPSVLSSSNRNSGTGTPKREIGLRSGAVEFSGNKSAERTPFVQKPGAPDQNKTAFAKAAEELKIKNNFPNAVSLSSLKQTDKKTPSAENISGLKNALADVLAKKTETKKSEMENGTQPKSRLPEGDAVSAAGREVPEKILRDILNMENDKK